MDREDGDSCRRRRSSCGPINRPTNKPRSRSGSAAGSRPIRRSTSRSASTGSASTGPICKLDSKIVLAEFDVRAGQSRRLRRGLAAHRLSRPDRGRAGSPASAGVGKALIDAAKHIGREGLYLHVNKDNDARARLLPEMRIRDRGRGRQPPVRRAGLHDDLAARSGSARALTQVDRQLNPNCSRASRA